MKFIHAAIVAALALGFHQSAPSVFAQPRPDSLRPLTRCDFRDGLRIVSADRIPVEIRERQVVTPTGQQRVSLADGYRVMLAYPRTDFFANLKIEMSQDSRYSDDKKTVVESLKYLSNQSSMEAGVPVPLEHEAYKGFDVYAVNFPTIDFYIENNPPTLGGGPIGTYVLFDDSRKMIVTVYFLNQRPERRQFKTMEEYRILRERFLEDYTTCTARTQP